MNVHRYYYLSTRINYFFALIFLLITPGVITYILLAGYPPFYVDPDDTIEDSDADPDALVLKKILNCDYNFIDSTWKDISPEAIDFIKSLMRPDPRHSVRLLVFFGNFPPHILKILKVCHLSFLKVGGGSSCGLKVQISLVFKNFLNVYQQYI